VGQALEFVSLPSATTIPIRSGLDLVPQTTEHRPMPRPMISPLGKRQPRALVIGLRRVVKDPKATVAQRLEACKLLAILEGYIEGPPKGRAQADTETTSAIGETTSPSSVRRENARKLRELLARVGSKPQVGVTGCERAE